MTTEAARVGGGRLERLQQGQLALLGALLVLAVVAWVVSDERMGGMPAEPGMALGSLGFYTTVWVLMMAAMMLPSVAPTVLLYDRLRRGHRAKGRGAGAEGTALFVSGYLAVWTGVGLAGYAMVELGRAVDPSWLAWNEAGRWVAGGVIAGAAVYQLTPAKAACLVKCRSPLMFLAERWRHGRTGALRLGAAHGAWCAGCCWALMAALFAIGVMSLGWMAVIAAAIAAEKLLPSPRALRGAVAVGLLALGLAVAVAPGDVPGFAQPGGGGHDGGGMMMR